MGNNNNKDDLAVNRITKTVPTINGRSEYGVNLMTSGPSFLNLSKRKQDEGIIEAIFASKKPRLDDLLTKMKRYSNAIESALKISVTGSSYKFVNSPTYIKNGELRSYQIQGLNWMIALYNQGLSGILGDEMGLGKTLQTISLIGYLRHVQKVKDKMLVIVPLTTLTNWQNEFENWCPTLKVVTVYGTDKKRHEIINTQLNNQPWDVCLTTYETCQRKYSKFAFSRMHWHHVILDEGTRIKNEKTQTSTIIGRYKSKYRLILTGTPLNNNLHELWALLSFLMPNEFESSDDFDTWFDDEACIDNKGTVVNNLHTILKPILLRRLKSEVEKDIKPKKDINVYVDITNFQREWYRKVLLKNIQIITGSGDIRYGRLNSLFMQLRKCTNHPYLFDGAEPQPFTNGNHIVYNSGKMIVLDMLLKKLKEQKSRVLIFSQFTSVLDIIEDYLYLHPEYEYCRLDGSTTIEDRTLAINEFQRPNSRKFVFLLSTRAGGMGINLTAADAVIIYDLDWNPQMDLQAIARAHRIGQTKEVRVFRLIAKNTVDEKMLERAAMKLQLNDVVIQSQVRSDVETNLTFSTQFVLSAVRFGADLILSNDGEYDGEKRDKLIHENSQKMINQMFDT